MTKEEMKSYADRYRKTMRGLSIGLSIFIFIIAIILFSVAVIFFIYGDSAIMYALGGVMIILGIVDTLGGIKLIKYSKKKFIKMSDKECAIHYCKIHGFDTKVE